MFGIGLPEMIVILAVALVVVGPDKLPELARSLAKGVVELKRTMHQLKNSLTEEGDFDSVQSEIRETHKEIQKQLIDNDFEVWRPDKNSHNTLIDAESDKLRPWEADQQKIPPPAKTSEHPTEALHDEEQKKTTPAADTKL